MPASRRALLAAMATGTLAGCAAPARVATGGLSASGADRAVTRIGRPSLAIVPAAAPATTRA